MQEMTREEKAQVETALESRLLLIKAKKNDIQFKKTSCLEKKGALGRGAAEFVRGELQTNRGGNTQVICIQDAENEDTVFISQWSHALICTQCVISH
jgi:hypothetical protein